MDELCIDYIGISGRTGQCGPSGDSYAETFEENPDALVSG